MKYENYENDRKIKKNIFNKNKFCLDDKKNFNKM